MIENDKEMIKKFLSTILGYNDEITNPIKVWSDQNDEAFQKLVCYIDEDDSRIWRALRKHSSLHTGLNALNSMSDIVHENLIVVVVEVVLKDMIQSLYDEFSAYITSIGHIIQGWTQAWRLCTTKWDTESLENRLEWPDQDDKEFWLPRYEIFTKPESSISSLRSMERVLGGLGWETSYDSHVPKGYVVDLNIMQALLPETMPFVEKTFRFVWKGPGNDPMSTGAGFSAEFELEPFDLEQFTSTNASKNMGAPANPQALNQDFNPSDWPAPTGSERIKKRYGDHFKSLSQQKGEDPDSFDYYTYAEPRGEGSWIFVIDSGFDTTHPVSFLKQELLADCIICEQH